LPEGNRDIVVERMQDKHGHEIQVAPGGGHEVKIPMPAANAGYGLVARYF
jgi:putative protease